MRRPSWLYGAVAIVAFQLLFALHAHAATDKAAQIAELLARYHEYGLFEGSVLVAENGQIIYKGAFGLANREWNIPNRPDTKFRIGSLTKQFTAMLVMQLVAKGKLSLDGIVADYLPYYPTQAAQRVTLHHLLTHTSGIGEATYQGPDDIRRDPYQPSEFIAKYMTGDLVSEPGSRYSYSNLGYFILGAILEEVTGKSYEALVQEQIFGPTGMKNSGYDRHVAIISNRAGGYVIGLGGTKNAPYVDTSLPFAAGALYSTVEDLYLWDQALYAEELLSRTWKQRYFTPFKDSYAYGWLVAKQSLGEALGERTFQLHGGTISGFQARLMRIVEDRTLIVLLSNRSDAPLAEINSSLVRVLYGFPVNFPKRPLAEELLRTVTGTGIEAAAEQYRGLKLGQPEVYDFREKELERLGRFLLQEKRAKEALAIFRLNAESYPDSPQAYENLGDTYVALGETHLALEMFEKALELNPENSSARKKIQALRAGPA